MKSISLLFFFCSQIFSGILDYFSFSYPFPFSDSGLNSYCNENVEYKKDIEFDIRHRFAFLINESSSSKTYRVLDSDRLRMIIVKIIPRQKNNESLSINEAKLTTKDFPKYPFLNVAETGSTCFYDDNNIYIEEENFITNLELYLKSSINSLSNSIVWRIYTALVVARHVEKLHNLGYIHRNLGLDNILVRNNVEFVLSDFGSVESNSLNDNKESEINYENLNSTEKRQFDKDQIDRKNCNHGIDINSLGLMLFSIITGDTTLYKSQITDFRAYIKAYKESRTNISYGIFSAYFKDLILQMIENDCDKIPSSQQTIVKLESIAKDSLRHVYKEYNESGISHLITDSLAKFNPIEKFIFKFDSILKERRCSYIQSFKCITEEQYIEILKENRIFFMFMPNEGKNLLSLSIDNYINKLEDKFYKKDVNKSKQGAKKSKCGKCSLTHKLKKAFGRYFEGSQKIII